MTRIRLITQINAPIKTCFDLARNIDVHQLSASATKEKAIAGRTGGLCEAGDTITWQAKHFGIKQKLTVQIKSMSHPFFFEDVMIRGAFKSMQHQHIFKEENGKTIMTDHFQYTVPFGIIGALFNKIVLRHYITGFLRSRNAILKQMAESQNQIV